jgi:hypothetical protein
MSDLKTPVNEEELSRYLDELPDLLMDGDPTPIDDRFPDGTTYRWDEELRETVETTPDGVRYVVNYQKGKGLVRIKEVVRGAA